jgi:CRISPR/Cas system-associated exonuclease Cas4 (RecB family)
MMTKMGAVVRIKAELFLAGISRTLLDEQATLRTSSETLVHAGAVDAVRKELDKLVDILKDDKSDKHWNVAARVSAYAAVLEKIPNAKVQHVRQDLIAAHKTLQVEQHKLRCAPEALKHLG